MKTKDELMADVAASMSDGDCVQDVVTYRGEKYEINVYTSLDWLEKRKIIENALANVFSAPNEGFVSYYPTLAFSSFWANVILYTTNITFPEDGAAIERLLYDSDIIEVIERHYPERFFNALDSHYCALIEFKKHILYNASRADSLAAAISSIINTIGDKLNTLTNEDIAAIVNGLTEKT